MQQLLDAQRRFFATQATKPIAFRKKQLDRLEKLLKQYEGELYAAIYADFKKSEFDTYTSEIALLYQDIKEAKRNLTYWAAKEHVPSSLINFPSKSYIIKEPLGACLVIGAWNYPYLLSLAPVIAAIAAGNTVILKPSELPARTSAVLEKLINTNFEPEFLKVVEGGVPETTELLKLQFNKIFFTGSTKVGKIVYEAAAKHLTPVTLELGGKSPAIVMADCKLKLAVKRLVWAKFLNAGQTCIAPDYILVEKSIETKFLQALREEIISEHFSVENHNYVQIINDDNFERLLQMIDAEKVWYGGETRAQERIIEPTVLRDIDFDHKSMQEEIFGPILPVISFESLDTILPKLHDLPKPLATYVFTASKKKKEQILKYVSFGGGMVNDAVMHIANSELPFGGVGMSGIGAYHGKTGFDCFSHHKSMVEKATWLELPLKYYPHTASRFKWIKRLLKLS
ncbi:MAG: aldehyde dehydrogenase [Marinirhabdus sp.]|nr:aldehyde dehydrogenase [Marinirhabdus sp.]